MAKYSPRAQDEVKQVMHKFKQGKLKIDTFEEKVKNPKQAVAIGLSEAKKKGVRVPNKWAPK